MQLRAAPLIWDAQCSAFQVNVATRTPLRAALPQAKPVIVGICASLALELVHLDVNHLLPYTESTNKETAHETYPRRLAAYFLVSFL